VECIHVTLHIKMRSTDMMKYRSSICITFGQDWSQCWSLQSGRHTTRLALLLNKSDCFM